MQIQTCVLDNVSFPIWPDNVGQIQHLQDKAGPLMVKQVQECIILCLQLVLGLVCGCRVCVCEGWQSNVVLCCITGERRVGWVIGNT